MEYTLTFGEAFNKMLEESAAIREEAWPSWKYWVMDSQTSFVFESQEDGGPLQSWHVDASDITDGKFAVVPDIMGGNIIELMSDDEMACVLRPPATRRGPKPKWAHV